MSVARITTLNFKSKEGADEIENTYKTNAPTEFSEAELTDLTYCVAMWMGLGRMTHVLGLDSGCEVTSQS